MEYKPVCLSELFVKCYGCGDYISREIEMNDDEPRCVDCRANEASALSAKEIA